MPIPILPFTKKDKEASKAPNKGKAPPKGNEEKGISRGTSLKEWANRFLKRRAKNGED